MTDFLDVKLKEIQDRLKELRPLVDEYHRLEAAEQALAGVDGASPRATTPRGRGGRGRGPAPAGSGGGAGGTGGRRGRRRGSGTRSAEALKLVKDRPGITIPELAEAMSIKQNYLYRVMPGLADDGLVVKSGRGWHAREPVAASSDEA